MKKSDNSISQEQIEQTLGKLKDYDLWMRTEQLIQKYYLLREPIKKIHKVLSEMPQVENFVQTFYQYILIKCFLNNQRQQFRSRLIAVCFRLKSLYLAIFNSLQNTGKKNVIIEYFFFLICLVSNTVLNELVTGKIKKIDGLNIFQYCFIVLINQTLGILVSPSIFRLMAQKFIIRQYKKDNLTANSTSHNLFNWNTNSIASQLQNIDVVMAAIPRRQRKLTKYPDDEYQDFKQILKKRLEVKDKVNPQKYFERNRFLNTPNFRIDNSSQRKTTIQCNAKKNMTQSQIQQNNYRIKSLRSNQCSSALKLSKKLPFENQQKSIDIKFNPIYTSRFYQDRKFKKDNRWDIQLQRQKQASLKKQLFQEKAKYGKKDVSSWQKELRKIKAASLQSPIEKLGPPQQKGIECIKQRVTLNDKVIFAHKSIDYSIRMTKSKLMNTLKTLNINAKPKQKQNTNQRVIIEQERKTDEYRQFSKLTDLNTRNYQKKVKPPSLGAEIDFSSVVRLKQCKQQFNKKYADDARQQQLLNSSIGKINFSKRFKDTHIKNTAKLR